MADPIAEVTVVHKIDGGNHIFTFTATTAGGAQVATARGEPVDDRTPDKAMADAFDAIVDALERMAIEADAKGVIDGATFAIGKDRKLARLPDKPKATPEGVPSDAAIRTARRSAGTGNVDQ